ncbi:T9SS type A sorting domain-containing protein [Brumimicrobium mesophilum]|uniref:T9SS type A sorting domain-containing protein n=1 Tax=Brumimicrobium mesophilum TaxID=392717 RepID=UPI000D1425F3|nr:T9SS type A sorting domain-containing protein [Brumimicrobium mesophilum]
MLLAIDIQQSIANIAWITLFILLFLIGYRIVVRRMKRGQIEKKLYLTLHPIEKEPASGVVPIFMEMNNPLEVEISIFSVDHSINEIIENKTYKKGGNIIQLDTRKFENGFYFYQAKSNNQKTKKRIEIRN